MRDAPEVLLGIEQKDRVRDRSKQGAGERDERNQYGEPMPDRAFRVPDESNDDSTEGDVDPLHSL